MPPLNTLLFIQAVESNSIQDVESLLNQGHSPNTEKKAFAIGFEPVLSICIRKKYIELAQLLLARGATPEPFSAQLIALQCKQDIEEGQPQTTTNSLVALTQQYNWPGLHQASPLLQGETPEHWIQSWKQLQPSAQRSKKLA